jgi:hypothetical protein
MPCFCFANGEKGGFRRGEKTGQKQQQNQYNNLVYHDVYGFNNSVTNKQFDV